MASSVTPNLGLSQWVLTDEIQMADFNRDNQIIDEAVSAKAIALSLTATVGTTWTASGSYYYQDVTLAEILATDDPFVDVLTNSSDNAINLSYIDAWTNVFRVSTSDGQIRLWAESQPNISFPIKVKVVR